MRPTRRYATAYNRWQIVRRRNYENYENLLCNDGYLQDLRYLGDVVGAVLVVRSLRSRSAVDGDRRDAGRLNHLA